MSYRKLSISTNVFNPITGGKKNFFSTFSPNNIITEASEHLGAINRLFLNFHAAGGGTLPLSDAAFKAS